MKSKIITFAIATATLLIVGAGAFPAEWAHSDLITIEENSGSDLVDYQILVELDASNFDFSKAQPDGADIRFAELDGALLDYWIEDWDSAGENAKVWVKVPSIPASSAATIRMWYGNAGAADADDGDAVFEFFDDFEDGDFTNNPTWDPIQCPYASITTIDGDRWIKLFRSGICDSPAYKTSGAFDLSQSFAITYKLRLSSGDQTGGGFALGTNDGYVLYNIGLNTGHWNAAETGPESWSSGFGYDTAKTKTTSDFRVEYFENYFYFASGNIGLSRETNHNIKLIYTASNHNWKLFVNGEDKGNIIGSTIYDGDISEIYISGKSATCPGNGAYFDDIIVRKYTDPAPTVTLSNRPPVADANGPCEGDEGSPITFDASLSTDLDGDSLTYRWDFDNDGTWDTGWSSSPTASYTWNDDWSGMAKLEVNDGELTDTDTASVIVNNVAPTITPLTGPVDPVEVDNSVSLTGDFTDLGLDDTHTATFDWDDTTSTDYALSNGEREVTGTHTYTEAGVYTVTLTVTDDDGGSDSEIFLYVVVYDPDGGFVTGGGWIYSPAGASAQYPDAKGKATFGFVSKYKKGATVPTGNTQFNFNAGNINFHSYNYDWLVIAGHKAMYKCTGTINDDGQYGFMLSAIDEKLTPSTNVDMFRIRIWDKENGDAVVYDNNIGNDDDADPTTALGGGTIIIHKVK